MKVFSTDRVFQTVTIAALAINLTALAPSGAFADRTIRLDAGSVIPVRLNDTISSSDSRKGDSFTATVKTSDGEDYGLPEGTKVDGTVTGVRQQRDKDPGVLELAFRRIRMPDGHSYAIDGSLIGLDNKSVERRSDGRLIAKPAHRNDRLTYAGYGAGAGLIVGLLTKRPLEDAILGGLLGYGFSALQKGHSDARDVVLKPGTELGVRIDRQATLTSYGDTLDNRYRDDNNDRRYRIDGDSSRYHRDTSDAGRVSSDRRDYGTANRTDSDGRYGGTDEIGVMLDDRDIRFDSTARPMITRNDVIMVPVAPVLRAAHVPYQYDSRAQSLRATGTSEPVRLSVGSSIAIVSGSHRVRMEASAQRINGSLYAPMKFFALATGYDVRYDSGSKTVILTSR